MSEAEAIAHILFERMGFSDRPVTTFRAVLDLVEKVLGEERPLPHYVIYFMGIEEIGSTLYDSYEDCVKDCEDEMIPVPVYGIPWPDPEEEGEEEDEKDKEGNDPSSAT